MLHSRYFNRQKRNKKERVHRNDVPSLFRAEDEAQTRDPQLGRLMLYQLSYFRIDSEESAAIRTAGRSIRVWARMDSNHRSRKTADLQSAPFGHSGICPFFAFEEVCFSIAVQRYNYLFKLQTKSIIFIAEIAHSSPLLPSLPPARSSACSIVFVVINP